RARLERLRAGARTQEIDQARSELAAARVDQQRAERELERVRRLYPQAAASLTSYDDAVTAYRRDQEQVKAAQARLDLLLAGTRPEEIAEAEAELARAEANYELLLRGTRSEDVAQARARVAELRGKLREIEVNLQELVVRAPERAVVEVLP